jgi:hypothetical protein
VYILRSWIEPTVGNGAPKEEGTSQGLVSNTGFICLTWVFPKEFFPDVDSQVTVSGWQRSRPSSVCVAMKKRLGLPLVRSSIVDRQVCHKPKASIWGDFTRGDLNMFLWHRRTPPRHE